MTRILISLDSASIEEMGRAAELEGFEDLAALVRYLLIQWKQAVDRKWDVKRPPSVAGPIDEAKPYRPRRKRGRARKPRLGPEDIPGAEESLVSKQRLPGTYYQRNRDKILAQAREKRQEIPGVAKPRGRRAGKYYPTFRRNDEKIMWGSVFFAAYDEETHTVTRTKPISVLARARIDALFANPPEYDAPGKYIAPARGEDSIPSDPR